MVEAVLPWHDKINAMAKEYAYFSLSVKDNFPADYVVKFQHIGLRSVVEACWMRPPIPVPIPILIPIPIPILIPLPIPTTWFRNNFTFLVGLKQTFPTKMTAMTVGSFHGFGKKVVLVRYLPVKSRFLGYHPVFMFHI